MAETGPWDDYAAIDAPAKPKAVKPVAALPKPVAKKAAPATPKPVATGPAPARKSRQFDTFSKMTRNQAARNLAQYEHTVMSSPEMQALPQPARDARMAELRTDPRIRALVLRAQGREAPSLSIEEKVRIAKPLSRDEQLAKVGRDAATETPEIAQGLPVAARAGFRRNLFSAPEGLAAGAMRVLPSSITGNETDLSYSDLLKVVRARTEAEQDQSVAGNVIGTIGGGLVGARAVGGPVSAITGRLGMSTSPIASRVGNFLQEIGTFRSGEKLANASKLATQGAGYGATQAASEGKNPAVGAAYGGAGALVLGGALKIGQVLTRPFRDALRLSSADQILSRVTKAPRAELEARAAQMRADRGAEPTTLEVLPASDRQAIMEKAVAGRPNVIERAEGLSRTRARNVGPEMSARAQEVLAPNRQAISTGIVDDLTRARSDVPEVGDDALVQAATRSPRRMHEVADAEARAIMAPHDDVRIVNGLDDLVPSVPNPNGGAPIAVDQEAATLIRAAAGLIRQRPQGNGVSAGEITEMISKVKSGAGTDTIPQAAAANAVRYLERALLNSSPRIARDAQRMVDAYAARARMYEGLVEGHAARLDEAIQPGTSLSNSQGQKRILDNAYDTPEGVAGRALGQGNRLREDFEGTAQNALRATERLAEDSRALAQNTSAGEAEQIARAARSQQEGMRALTQASSVGRQPTDNLSNEEALAALAGLHPATFPQTKAGAVRKLLGLVKMPESRARTIVDMIYSQNPDMVRRALRAVGREPNGAEFSRWLANAGGHAANMDSQSVESEEEMVPPTDTIVPEASAGEPPTAVETETSAPWEDYAGEDTGEGEAPYGRAVVESIFPGIEVTDDIRDPNSDLGRKNPDSFHVQSDEAVDVRPIPGMTFDEFIQQIENAGYTVLESRDEVTNPSGWATGPHWHVVLG